MPFGRAARRPRGAVRLACCVVGALALTACGDGGGSEPTSHTTAEQRPAPTSTEGSEAEALPRPGPGGPILYMRFDHGQFRLWTVRLNGSGSRPLTVPPPHAWDNYGRWSPDGTKVVFRRAFGVDEGYTHDEVFVTDADGTHAHSLTADCAGDATPAARLRPICLDSMDPSWSPDGRRIAFARVIGPITDDGRGFPTVLGIFTMNADGTHLRQLTQFKKQSGTEDHFPSWSPDGRRIAFQRQTNTGSHPGRSSIYVVPAHGGSARLVHAMPRTRVNSGIPRWAPDGRTLIFDDRCNAQCPQSGPTGSSVFAIRPDGSGLRRLIHIDGAAYNGTWSPDGHRVVFAEGARGNGDVYVASADGTHVRRLTDAATKDSHAPDWRASS